MEKAGLNLAGVCDHLGLSSDNLVQSLTNSFAPHVDAAVSAGVITEAERELWMQRIESKFAARVNWDG